MCVRTRCRSVDELVVLFGRYLEGNSLFVATLGARGEGSEAAFTIVLSDGVIALRGRGVVEKAWNNGENPFRLPGILLGVKMLTASSKALFDRIRAERDRNAANAAPLGRVAAPLADISSGIEAARWKEETFSGPPLADRLPARTRAATIPPLARTTTAPRASTPKAPAAPAKPAITRNTITRPKITVPPVIAPLAPLTTPPLTTPPEGTPPPELMLPLPEPTTASVEPTVVTAEPPIATLLAPVGRRDYYRARAIKRAESDEFAEEPPTIRARDMATPSDAAATIPQVTVDASGRRMAGWTAVLLVLLPLAGFTTGAVLSNTSAGEARPAHAEQIPVHATIEIDGTKYSVDVVLTAERERER